MFPQNPVSPPLTPSPTLDDARDFQDAVVTRGFDMSGSRAGFRVLRGNEVVNSFQVSSLATNRNRNLRSVFASKQLSCFVFVMIQTRNMELSITRKHSSRMRTVRCSGRREGWVSARWVSARHPPVNRMTDRQV